MKRQVRIKCSCMCWCSLSFCYDRIHPLEGKGSVRNFRKDRYSPRTRLGYFHAFRSGVRHDYAEARASTRGALQPLQIRNSNPTGVR